MTPRKEAQAAAAVLMVRPVRFASNPETLASNKFQSRTEASTDIATLARAEFDRAAAILTAARNRVHVIDGRAAGDCPEEVFPNNWVSFHADGTAVLYPMLAPSRRRERRGEFLEALRGEYGYAISRTLDLTAQERDGRFLEGTGSLVLDRPQRTAYCCESPRTNRAALAEFAKQLDYECIVFDAADARGQPIYHTNVLMAVGSRFAIVCLAAVADAAARETIVSRLERSGRTVIDITLEQMHGFAANLLQLATPDGPVIALSARAFDVLTASQRERLGAGGRLVTIPIPTIETYGGGSVRCMLAEVHLPLAADSSARKPDEHHAREH
jgi:hypothetical protein